MKFVHDLDLKDGPDLINELMQLCLQVKKREKKQGQIFLNNKKPKKLHLLKNILYIQ